MKPKTTIVLALCAFSSSAALGQTDDAPTKTLAVATLTQDVACPAGRLALVQAAACYCDSVGRVFPRNSPTEETWLSGELAAGGDRPARALMSAEFGRRHAAQFVDSCIQAARNYEGGDDKRRSILWIAYAFAGFGPDAEYYAKKNGVDVEQFAFGFLPGKTVGALIKAAIAE